MMKKHCNFLFFLFFFVKNRWIFPFTGREKPLFHFRRFLWRMVAAEVVCNELLCDKTKVSPWSQRLFYGHQDVGVIEDDRASELHDRISQA